MNKEKISSQEIIDLVATKAAVSKRAAEEFLKVMISTIEDALLAGETVKVKGFGIFKLQWNEPRKSVNVQTGEEILLAGFHKVAFAPETSLKELVNEPFAHLEAVQLDGENDSVSSVKPDEVALDPLRIFTEQASEIKDLLSEIQALSSKPQSLVESEISPIEDVELPVPVEFELLDDEVEFEDIELLEDESEVVVIEESVQIISSQDENIASEINPLDDFIVEDEVVVVPASFLDSVPSSDVVLDETQLLLDEIKSVYSVPEEQIASVESTMVEDIVGELESTPYLVGMKPIRKVNRWVLALIVLSILIGSTVGLYLFYPPMNDFGKSVALKSANEMSYLKNAAIPNLFSGIKGWFTTDSIPKKQMNEAAVPKIAKKPVPAKLKVPVDSMKLLLDGPRVYEESIATEQIDKSSKLTTMSEHYYGSKDFWVYIYEANVERIENPDEIQEGTLIRIPKLDSRLIDVSNPRCLQKAHELQDEYVKK